MQHRFDTILIVDGQGGARLEYPLAVPPGRRRVTALIDDVAPPRRKPGNGAPLV